VHAEDAYLPAKSELNLKRIDKSYVEVYGPMGMGVNVNKSKVMVVVREGNTIWEIRVNGNMLELVNKFQYFGFVIDKIGECRKEVDNRMTQGRKVAGDMNVLVKNRNLNIEAARGLHEGVYLP